MAREISLRDTHPEWTEEQLAIAEEKFDAYLEICLRIYNRILEDPVAWVQFEALLKEQREKRVSMSLPQ